MAASSHLPVLPKAKRVCIRYREAAIRRSQTIASRNHRVTSIVRFAHD
jgi:hypothetical protein